MNPVRNFTKLADRKIIFKRIDYKIMYYLTNYYF
jgi:hypothetical protein